MATHAVLSSGAKMWRSIVCPKSELRLDLTLACGQSFRWRETSEGHWTGVMKGRVWTLTQMEDRLWYHVYEANPKIQGPDVLTPEKCVKRQRLKGCVKTEEDPVSVTSGAEEEETMLRDYFQLNVNLGDLYREWGEADTHFKQIADIFSGIRMLRQDPTECLFSFICTSNNHISRIQGMIERLCEALGTPLSKLDQTSYHDFPSLMTLKGDGVEARLRELGFGYRAPFLQQSAQKILDDHGPEWLESLRSVPYGEARDVLRSLPGVGTKVADCVCLMSLDKANAVPIDTHVWQIAKRDYRYSSGKEPKSITDKLHRDLGDFFRKLWGPYAGWTQSVLFCADLKKFQYLKQNPELKRPKHEKHEEQEELVTSKKVKNTMNKMKKEKKAPAPKRKIKSEDLEED